MFVTVVLQWCYSGVAVVLEWFCSKVTVVSPGYCLLALLVHHCDVVSIEEIVGISGVVERPERV